MSTEGPAPDELARLDLEVFPRLMRTLAIEVGLTGHGDFGHLSMTQMRALKRLADGPKLGSDLAHDLGITPPTVSAAVDSLVRRGLVERGEAPGDRRVVPLRLTPEGRRCFKIAREKMAAALAKILEQLTPEERAGFELGLKGLARVLDKRLETPES